MMAMTEAQAATLLEKINAAQTRLFYIKTPIEYGEIGTEASDRDSAVTP
jgi:hypothetical protein